MKHGVESLGRVRAQGIALLLITFVVGALAGISLERVRAARLSPPASAGIGMMQPQREGRLPMMFRRLDLSPEQRAQIARILEAGRPRTDAILNQMLPRLRAVTDSVQTEIRAVLTPEQIVRLDTLMAEMRPRRGQMREARPGRGRGRRGPPPPQP